MDKADQYSEQFEGIEEFAASQPRYCHQHEFKAIQNDIQIALNNSLSKRKIYDWCVQKKLFTGAYCTFTKLVKKFDLHPLSEEEIAQRAREAKLKKLF